MELTRSTSRRGFSVRSILTFVLAVFITGLLWAIVVVPSAHAEEPKADWKGDSILYDGHQYYEIEDSAKANGSHGLAVGTHYYVFVEVISERPLQQKAHVIYFAPGSDPPTATTAKYAVYDYSASKVFSNPSGTTDIVITPQGQSSSYSSCTVEGIGWIICPVSVFLADAMDKIFEILSGFIAVQPPTTGDNKSNLYVAWNVMRSIANVAFIIAFMVIIYSQLTSFGVSNYGIKKLIPRLVIAAVLVNVSFYVCAIAVDISNVFGYSLQDILNNIRENTFNITNETWSDSTTTWSNVMGAVLSGGAVVAGGVGAIAATGGTIGGAIYLLLPLLLGLVLTVLFVLLILAARQAIIIILIVIAPLAFVANLLPNTEKWFEKWRDLFMTMLIFFPAFSLVFGGSQLAGGIIIQNATSIFTMIFGMAVQVAPLVITPLLLKLSGGLLGRIAGIVNDPRKGLMDRTKNWSNARAEMHKARGIGGDLKPYNLMRRAARGMAYGNRRVERNTERYKSGFEAYGKKRDISSRRGQAIEVANYMAKHEAEELGHNFDQAMHEARAGSTEGLERLRMLEGTRLSERIRTNLSSTTVEEMRIKQNKSFGKFATATAHAAQHLDQESRIIENATATAQRIQQTNFAEEINANGLLQVRAGGIDKKGGAQRALANAFTVMNKARDETIANAANIIDYNNLSNEQVRLLSQGVSQKGVVASQDIIAAALQRTLGGGDTEQIAKAVREIDFSFSSIADPVDREELQIIAAKALEGNSSRPPEFGMGALGRLRQGNDFKGNVLTGPLGNAGVSEMIIAAINNQKIDAGKLQSAGMDYSKEIFQVLNNPALLAQLTPEATDRLKKELSVVLDPNREASERLGDSKPFLENLKNLLP